MEMICETLGYIVCLVTGCDTSVVEPQIVGKSSPGAREIVEKLDFRVPLGDRVGQRMAPCGDLWGPVPPKSCP